MWKYEHVRSPLAHQHLYDTRGTESQVSILHLFEGYNHLIALYFEAAAIYNIECISPEREASKER